MEPIDNERIDELEAHARAATPGPWTVRLGNDGLLVVDPAGGIIVDYSIPTLSGEDRIDAAYIAAVSPNVVLELIAELRRLRRDLERVRERAGPGPRTLPDQTYRTDTSPLAPRPAEPDARVTSARRRGPLPPAISAPGGKSASDEVVKERRGRVEHHQMGTHPR